MKLGAEQENDIILSHLCFRYIQVSPKSLTAKG